MIVSLVIDGSVAERFFEPQWQRLYMCKHVKYWVFHQNVEMHDFLLFQPLWNSVLMSGCKLRAQ